MCSFLWGHPSWKPPCFWNSQAELAKDGLPRDLALSHLSSSLTVWLMPRSNPGPQVTAGNKVPSSSLTGYSVSRNPGQIHLPLTLGLLVVSPGSSGGKQQRWGPCPVHVVGSQHSECPGWCTPGILVLVSGAHSSMSQPLAVSSHFCSSVMNCQEQPSSSRR